MTNRTLMIALLPMLAMGVVSVRAGSHSAGSLVFEAGGERLGVSRAMIDKIVVGSDPVSGMPLVNLLLADRGKSAFETFTGKHTGEMMTLTSCGNVLVEARISTAISSGVSSVRTETHMMAETLARAINDDVECTETAQ